MPCTTHLTTLTFQIKQAITLQADIGPRVLHTCAFICTAGPYASHAHDQTDLARKNAKFTMKLSTTRHAALGRCGESRRSNTLTVTSRIYNVYSVCKQTAYTVSPWISLRTCTCIYINSPNYLRRSIFLLLVALLDTCNNRLRIVIKSL